MAEIQESGNKKGGKSKQKKMTVRVDFTPMVDMNMLLITFFMLCTSLSKPQTMETPSLLEHHHESAACVGRIVSRPRTRFLPAAVCPHRDGLLQSRKRSPPDRRSLVRLF